MYVHRYTNTCVLMRRLLKFVSVLSDAPELFDVMIIHLKINCRIFVENKNSNFLLFRTN